ncbi:MAG: sporulation protein YqfD, partial [Acutalibacteraceae bacterium]
DRAGLAIGGVFFVVFMCIASLFVWNVETVGSEKLSSQTILLAAKNAGIYSGALSRNIDQLQAANEIITTLNGKLSWVSVNIKGSHAIIEVRDYIERRDDETYSEPCNIIADFDGVLLSVEVHNGAKASYEGSGVKKGDLLISGISENRDTSSIFMEARGIITAIHNDTCAVEKNMKHTVKKYVKQKTVSKLGFFGIKIPLGFFNGDGDYDESEETAALYFGKIRLPFYISKVTRAYYVQSDEEDIEKNVTLLFDEYTYTEYNKYMNTRVLDKKISVSEKENKITVTADCECIDFMGVKQKISFDK